MKVLVVGKWKKCLLTNSTTNTSGGDVASSIGSFTLQTSLISLESDIFKNNFKRKENKFFANLINVSAATGGEVLWGASSSGIKGFWSTIKMKIDIYRKIRNNDCEIIELLLIFQ